MGGCPRWLGVRSVPNAASYGMLFSVSYVESRRSNSQRQRPRGAHNGHLEMHYLGVASYREKSKHIIFYLFPRDNLLLSI